MTGAYYTHDGRVELCRGGIWNRPTMVRVKAWNLDEQKIVYEKYLESRQQKTMKIYDGGEKFISNKSTVVKKPYSKLMRFFGDFWTLWLYRQTFV